MISSRLSQRFSHVLVLALLYLVLGCPGPGPGPETDDALIVVSSESVTFSGTANGADPTAQTITISNAGDGTLSGVAATVAYSTGQPTGWLSATLSGPETPTTLMLAVTMASLPAGSYTAVVTVTSDAATNSPKSVNVTINVAPSPGGGAASIALSSTSQSFIAPQGGANPPAQTVDVTNRGEGSLEGLTAAVTYTAGQPTGWLNATLSSSAAPSTLTLAATTGSLPAGTYTALVAVTSASASNSPQNVSVAFNVAPPSPTPLIALSAASRIFTGPQSGGNPPAQTVEVTNGGGGTLSGLAANVSYTAGQPGGWLNARLSSTRAPSTLTLTPTTGSLAAGTYTATVAVTSGSASNSPQVVSVTFTVTPPSAQPRIVLSAASRSFSAVQGGGNPPEQTVDVTNGGGGTLASLAANVTYTAGQPTGWLNAQLSATTAPSTLTLTAITGSLPAGTYRASVAVASDVASNSPQHVSVSFTVGAPPTGPTIVLSKTTLTFSATQGGANPPVQRVDVSSGGGGELTGLAAAVGDPSPIPKPVSAELSGTTTPATLTIRAVSNFTPGTYNFPVTVSATGAAPQSITVTLTITAVAPTWESATAEGTTVTLRWSYPWPGGLASSNDGYRLEESTLPTGGFREVETYATRRSPFSASLTRPAGTYYYRVRAQLASMTSPFSEVQSVTVAAAESKTIFVNRSVWPVIFMTIDGVQQFPSPGLEIPSGASYTMTLAPGSHTYEIRTGVWDGNQRFEMYIHRGSFTQRTGEQGTFNIDNPTIQQLLTQFTSRRLWEAAYLDGNIVAHSSAFRFYSNGDCTYYKDGNRFASCTYRLERYVLGEVTFSVAYDGRRFTGVLREIFGVFHMDNVSEAVIRPLEYYPCPECN